MGTVASAGVGLSGRMRCRHARVLLRGGPPSRVRFPPEIITVAVRWYLRYGLPPGRGGAAG